MTTTLWVMVFIIGVLTFGIRLSIIALADRWELPPPVQRALRFVPVTVLTAIFVPAMVLPNGTVDLAPTNARLVAGLVAIVVVWRTRQVILSIALGMGTLWLLQFALHR